MTLLVHLVLQIHVSLSFGAAGGDDAALNFFHAAIQECFQLCLCPMGVTASHLTTQVKQASRLKIKARTCALPFLGPLQCTYVASYRFPARPNSDVDKKKGGGLVGPVSLQRFASPTRIRFPQAQKETVSGPLSHVACYYPQFSRLFPYTSSPCLAPPTSSSSIRRWVHHCLGFLNHRRVPVRVGLSGVREWRGPDRDRREACGGGVCRRGGGSGERPPAAEFVTEVRRGRRQRHRW